MGTGKRRLSGEVLTRGFPCTDSKTSTGKTDITVSTPVRNSRDGQIVTNGGRVVGITAKGKDLKEARKNAYEATDWIQFANKYMRHDIGKAIDEA